MTFADLVFAIDDVQAVQDSFCIPCSLPRLGSLYKCFAGQVLFQIRKVRRIRLQGSPNLYNVIPRVGVD